MHILLCLCNTYGSFAILFNKINFCFPLPCCQSSCTRTAAKFLIKPVTSKAGNSEHYIISIGFTEKHFDSLMQYSMLQASMSYVYVHLKVTGIFFWQILLDSVHFYWY